MSAPAAPAPGAPTAGAPVPTAPKRRSTELSMLVFALLITVAAYVNVGLGFNGKLPSGALGYGLGFGVLLVVAHLTVRRFAPWADPLMLPLAAILNGLGLVMIHRLQLASQAHQMPGNTLAASATATQLMWSAFGILAFIAVLVLCREVRALQRYTYTLGIIGLILLAVPALLPSSMSAINGAKVWILIGGFSLQPGEFAKLLLAVFFAGYLVVKRDVLALAGRHVLGIDLPRGRDLGPVLAAWAASLLILVFESDVGTSAMFFGLFVAMLYIATQRTSWLLIGVALFLFGALITAGLFAHVGQRFDIWLHTFSAANINCNTATQSTCAPSYQLAQGVYGMGSGGILGRGWGQGQPYVTPLAQSDFIVSAFGEELGMTGLMAVLLVYGLIVERGLRAALAVRDPFSKLFAGGLSFVLGLQVFVIVGGVTRLIPLTGITTPFLSQGGSSLVASWMLIALLMRVSDSARRPPPQPIQDEGMTQVVRIR